MVIIIYRPCDVADDPFLILRRLHIFGKHLLRVIPANVVASALPHSVYIQTAIRSRFSLRASVTSLQALLGTIVQVYSFLFYNAAVKKKTKGMNHR